MTEPKPTMAKPFVISKWVVSEAYEKVKANQGAARVDGQSIAEFERDLKGNLYKLWNPMSSGTYFPSPVRAVEIPKAGGSGSGLRRLMSRTAGLSLHWFAGVPIHDPTSNFKLRKWPPHYLCWYPAVFRGRLSRRLGREA